MTGSVMAFMCITNSKPVIPERKKKAIVLILPHRRGEALMHLAKRESSRVRARDDDKSAGSGKAHDLTSNLVSPRATQRPHSGCPRLYDVLFVCGEGRKGNRSVGTGLL